jgi:hypothetical protein
MLLPQGEFGGYGIGGLGVEGVKVSLEGLLTPGTRAVGMSVELSLFNDEQASAVAGLLRSDAAESLATHRVVWAAERARATDTVVHLERPV